MVPQAVVVMTPTVGGAVMSAFLGNASDTLAAITPAVMFIPFVASVLTHLQRAPTSR